MNCLLSAIASILVHQCRIPRRKAKAKAKAEASWKVVSIFEVVNDGGQRALISSVHDVNLLCRLKMDEYIPVGVEQKLKKVVHFGTTFVWNE